jgi:hypothetical protein
MKVVTSAFEHLRDTILMRLKLVISRSEIP